MKLDYNCTGKERKALAQLISEAIDAPAQYLYAPTFGFQVGWITVDKNGVLHMDDNADPEWVENIKDRLALGGFTCISETYDNPQPAPVMDEEEPEEEEFTGVCICMPRSIFTDSNLENLKAIVAAKGDLICKALGVADLPIEVTDHKVEFLWFPGHPTPEELNTYSHFITKLCDMARNQKRVNAKGKDAENEKYAFRCFLLRLGFIGDEYKTARKILLRNLSGSSAFREGTAKEVQE